MITITPSTGAVKFDFDGNQYYLNDGSISYPLNALSMTIDESDIITLKNQAGDIVLGCHLDELGKSKAEMEELYASSFVGGAGVTPEEVETMIEEAVSGKANTSAVTQVNTALNSHVNNTEIHVTAADKASWDAKVDQADLYDYATTTALNSHVNNATIHVTSTDKSNWDGAVTALGGNKIVALTQAEYDALATKDSHTLYIITD